MNAKAGAGDGSARVAGIVLAAGRSLRMGRPKPLLRVEGTTFMERVVGTLLEGGCEAVTAVTGGLETAGAGEAAERAGASVVVNPAPESEQIDSLRLGLRSLPDPIVAAIVLPVDHPLVRPTTVAALVRAHRERPGVILRAAHSGRPGHPTLFPRAVWPRLFDERLPEGARSVLEDPAVDVLNVAVDDAGVLADIDTPAAYDRWIGA